MIDSLFTAGLYVIPFLVILTVIVFVHEMGHYLVARLNGIAVDAFSIGFGPELIGRTDKRGTRWKLSAIPLGGYVRFKGDLNEASIPDPDVVAKYDGEEAQTLFVNKNVWRRIAVVAAGPVANILFTFLLLYALLLGYGRMTLDPTVEEVLPGSVAEAAGLLAGDRIVEVDGFTIRGFEDFQRLIATAPHRPVDITVERDGSELALVVIPEAVETTDRFGNTHTIGRIGVSRAVGEGEVVLYRPGPVEAVAMTFEEIAFIVDRTVAFLGDFFVGRGDLDQIGGPVRVAQVSGEVATLGVLALVNLTALLSLNIGLVNLLPIPMLDGGHLVYFFYEAVRGKPLSQRIQEIGFRIGFAIVCTLMVFTLANDTFLRWFRI